MGSLVSTQSHVSEFFTRQGPDIALKPTLGTASAVQEKKNQGTKRHLMFKVPHAVNQKQDFKFNSKSFPS
jgi:hypothetical protein